MQYPDHTLCPPSCDPKHYNLLKMGLEHCPGQLSITLRWKKCSFSGIFLRGAQLSTTMVTPGCGLSPGITCSACFWCKYDLITQQYILDTVNFQQAGDTLHISDFIVLHLQPRPCQGIWAVQEKHQPAVLSSNLCSLLSN